ERFQSAAAFHDILARCVGGREPTGIYDPSADTQDMITPPFPMPAGAVRPLTAAVPIVPGGDTAPMAMAPAAAAPATAAPGTAPVTGAQAAAFHRSNRIVLYGAAAIVLVTIVGAWLWNQGAKVVDSTANTDAVAPNSPAPVTTSPPPPVAPPPVNPTP